MILYVSGVVKVTVLDGSIAMLLFLLTGIVRHGNGIVQQGNHLRLSLLMISEPSWITGEAHKV